jgi:hypothetical protein
MDLREKLRKENIDPAKLEKGLKHIGLNLEKFNSFQEEDNPNLLELFRIALDLQPTSTKFMKMDLRSKLEKVLKGQPINNHGNSIATKEITEKKSTIK